jgi:hypothetical protein
VFRTAVLVAFAAFMTFQSYLAVETWGLCSAPTVSIVTVTVAACLLLLWVTLRWD